MPTTNAPAQPKKKNNKELLLELINKQYGLASSAVMEKAFKTQDKQIEEAMMQGMGAKDIAKSEGIDLSQLGVSPEQPTPQTQPKPEGKKGNFWYTPFQMNKESGDVTPASLLGGLISQHPDDTLKMVEALMATKKNQQISPEGQMATLKKTKALLDKEGIKAKVNVTATGVPTISTEPELGLNGLEPDQQLQALALARKYGTGRNLKVLVPSIAAQLMEGKTIDQIEDNLRMSGQSPEFSGAIRGAMQNITSKWGAGEKQTAFDEVDDYAGDPEAQRQAIKRTTLKAATADQQNQVMGKERTADLLNEISGDLEILEKNGTPTNWMTGNIEGLMGRVGLVKNPAMREVATKIAVAVMAYRRSMTGVQFGMIENKEYKRIFPNIDKVSAFNSATAKALTSVFSGDTEKFYKQSMGEKNYTQIFGKGQTNEQTSGNSKYQRYLEIVGGK